MRATRPSYAELTPQARARSIARSYTAVLIRRRRLERRPCEECGAQAQAHHADDGDPRRVRWLCGEHRRQVRRAEAEARRRAEVQRLAEILASLRSCP